VVVDAPKGHQDETVIDGSRSAAQPYRGLRWVHGVDQLIPDFPTNSGAALKSWDQPFFC